MSRGPWRPIVLGCLGLLVLAVAWLGVMYARIVTDPSPSTDPHGYVRLFMVPVLVVAAVMAGFALWAALEVMRGRRRGWTTAIVLGCITTAAAAGELVVAGMTMALLTSNAMGTGTPGVTPPSLGSTSVLLVPGLVGLAVGLGMVLSGLRGQRALSPPQPAVWR